MNTKQVKTMSLADAVELSIRKRDTSVLLNSQVTTQKAKDALSGVVAGIKGSSIDNANGAMFYAFWHAVRSGNITILMAIERSADSQTSSIIEGVVNAHKNSNGSKDHKSQLRT